MSADLNIANEKITSENIAIVGNGVDVNGKGSLGMAGQGSLDYDGLAKVAAGQNPLTNILGNLSGATLADGKLTFPFGIGGTLQSPRFTLKSASGGKVGGLQSALGTGAGQPGVKEQPADLVQGIAGLLKKKRSQDTQPTKK